MKKSKKNGASLPGRRISTGYSIWASSFSWNAIDGTDSQVLGATLGVKLIFVFSVTFGTKGLWGWFVARLFECFKKLLFRWNINFLSFLRRKIGFKFYSVTYLVRVPNGIYQEKIPPEFDSWCPKTIPETLRNIPLSAKRCFSSFFSMDIPKISLH